MKGFWSMLTGKGFREYQDEHNNFRDAIPDEFPREMTEEQRMEKHPAYSGKHSGTLIASAYRRGYMMRGPQSKSENRRLEEYQKLREEYDRQVASLPSKAEVIPFNEWVEMVTR